MKPSITIPASLLAIFVASLLAMAGSQSNVQVLNLPLFMFCGISAFVIQWILFAPAYLMQTERFFDISGSLTYILLVLLVLTVVGFEDPRALLIGGAIILWAARLGPFLFRRISRDGEDRRFRKIKPNFFHFFMVWTLQGLWVFLTAGAALAAMSSSIKEPLGLYAISGLILFAVGFAIEVIADQQKSNFRADPANRNRFIEHGLWRYSRHPNYFGEIMLWFGIAIMAIPVLQGWQYATLISPFFVIVLLTKISGLPMLENRADKQWGRDEGYQKYKATTPLLVPRLR